MSGNKHYPLAPKPCPHPAGSEERIRCYTQRVSKGYAVFHPGDHVEKVDQRQAGKRGFHKDREAA